MFRGCPQIKCPCNLLLSAVGSYRGTFIGTLCYWFIEENKESFFIFVILVFLEHDQLDSYINEMVIQNEDELGNRPTYYCGICHHQGNFKQDIERHIESSHIQTNPFFCPTCGSSHKTRRTLKIHQRSHKNV